ncbi:MAG: type II 3-dehydroquinate dehydratase [Gammaproteobacteria bacterium]|jgi:3-dehydroquinate dehydratase-2|nr:type II 3-dehydroquinate dehydratase [Gammaproteobacteria bacterium]MCP4880256.1 type II 3-dehydroquinate dehydratase [Gammaproteobacteria bacterium]MDP6165696.1 type II 3-dehydroquinate dehydratase [Gammaproteobacteria bacterium]
MARILLLNGPNINMLGKREPGIYGHLALSDIEQQCTALGEAAGLDVTCLQSNAEVALIEAIHEAPEAGIEFIIINPAAFTHTSVALRDAILSVNLPFIEVHISNVHARETFRHHSYFSDVAQGVIVGLGPAGYNYAMQSAISHIQSNN